MSLLSLVGSIMLFMLLRVEEIAKFASLGAPVKDILYFVAILLPQLAVLVVPLALFCGIYITWHRFSQSCELLGALTCGLRVRDLILPTFAVGFVAAAFAGYIALDVAPKAQLNARILKNYWSQVNPAHLLRSEKVWQLPGAILISRQKQEDLSVFIISHHQRQDNTQLIYVDKLQIDQDSTINVGLSCHFSFYPQSHPQYLSLENITKGNYHHLLGSSAEETFKQIAPDQLPLGVLFDRMIYEKKVDKKIKKKLNLEIPRRLFFFVLPLSFCALALVASFHPNRRAQEPGARVLTFWVLGMLIGYFTCKGLSPGIVTGSLVYLGLPLLCTFWCLKRLQRLGAPT